MGILERIGIDWLHLIAQLVNFVVVLIVLRIFAYKPILKLFKDRREKIEAGIKQAEEAEKKSTEANAKADEVVAKANKKVSEVVGQAKDDGKKVQAQLLSQAQTEAGKIVAEAKKTSELKEKQVVEDAKKKVAEMAVLVAEKILQEKIDAQKHQQLIETSIKEL